MKFKTLSIHALPLLTWLMSIVIYIYSQNNLYSCVFCLLLLGYLSQTYISVAWKDLCYSWLLVSVGMMIFYGLFLHEGNARLFDIPGDIPLLSGLVSLNAVLYGFFLGGSLCLALFIFSLFSSFLKYRRPRFYLPGIWSSVSVLFSFLSYFVSFLFNHRESFQKRIKNRGLAIGRFMKIKLFLHDASFHALENAFSFAETLEMRGFTQGHLAIPNSKLSLLSLALLGLLVTTLSVYRIDHSWMMLIIIIFSAFGFLWTLKKIKQSSAVSKTYDYTFSNKDWLIMGWSLFFLTYCLYVSFQTQSFLSQQNLSDYLYFETKVHVLFLIHASLSIFMFPTHGKQS